MCQPQPLEIPWSKQEPSTGTLPMAGSNTQPEVMAQLGHLEIKPAVLFPPFRLSK